MLMLDTYVNQSVIALTAGRNLSDAFLYFDLERRYDELRRISDSQSSRGSLTTRLVGALPAIVPDLRVMRAFEDLVTPTLRRIEVGLRESETLASLRVTLLPKLLSGEVRLAKHRFAAEAVR